MRTASATGRIRKTRRVLFALIFLFLLCFNLRQTARRSKRKYGLYIAFVSSHVPGKKAFINTLHEISLQSLIDALNLPSVEVEVRLGYYLECSSHTTDFDVYEPPVDDEFLYEMSLITQSMAKFRSVFSSWSAYCSPALSHSICHARKQLDMFTDVSEAPFFFLMEHDWILFPSQVRLSVPMFASLRREIGVEYILLDRGDRKHGKLRASHLPLYEATEYANNPFMSTQFFIELFTDGDTEVCGRLIDKTDWELVAGKILFQHNKKNSSQMTLLGPRSGKTTMFHWDGRFASLQDARAIGPLHQVLRGATQGDDALRNLVRQLETVCQDFNFECRPYFLRVELMSALSQYIAEHAIRDCVLQDVLSLAFNISTVHAQALTTGHLPHNPCSSA